MRIPTLLMRLPVRVETFFLLNCRDVVGRERTAAEKADVLGGLLTLKP